MSTRATVTINTKEEREQVARWARNVEPGTVVTFRKKSRSTEQSAKMWAMLHEVSEQVEWYGQKIDAEDWKDMFTASLRHARVVPGIDKGTFVPLGMHTSTMTIEEMTNLIELIYAFGADHGVVFKEPPSASSPHETEDGASPVPNGAPEAGDAIPGSPASTNTDPTGGPKSGDAAGTSALSPEVPAAVETENQILIRFARDVLPMAGDPETSSAALSAVEKGWAEDIKKLSAGGQAKATSISKSMRAIFNGSASLDAALDFFSDVLGCDVTELGGKA